MTVMPRVEKRLDQFFANIGLDSTRRARIDGALNNLNSWAASSPLRRLMIDGVFPQGSYAHQTVVRPLSPSDEYDVDVVLPIDVNRHREDYQDPEDILRYVKNSLGKYPDYQGKVHQRRCCVRVRFAGSFHLDVVPAHVTGDPRVPFQVPNRNTNEWEPSNPPGYSEWIEKSNGGPSKFFLRQTTKAFKRWRDLKFSPSRAPKSIVLTTLLGLYNPGRVGQDDVDFQLYYGDDSNILTYMIDSANMVLAAMGNGWSTPRIWNPSMPEGQENLARNWDAEDYALFRTKLGVFAERLEKAYLGRLPDVAVRRLRSQFGDAFPAA